MKIDDIDTFLNYYARIKHRTKALFTCIPPQNIEWTYQTGKFTIGDIIRHLALTERYMYVENALLKPSLYKGCGQDLATGYEAVIQLYEKLAQESADILSKLKKGDLEKKCQTPAGSWVTVWKLLRAMVEHEIHHRAAIYTYLGMLNIKTPPIFGLTSEEVIEGSKGSL